MLVEKINKICLYFIDKTVSCIDLLSSTTSEQIPCTGLVLIEQCAGRQVQSSACAAHHSARTSVYLGQDQG